MALAITNPTRDALTCGGEGSLLLENIPGDVAATRLRENSRTIARVRAALDRTDPVNLMATVHELAKPPPASWEDTRLIVQGICSRAMAGPVDTDEAVPGALHSRTSATFADIVYHLRSHLTEEFEIPNDRPMTFTRILLNVVQDEFEAMTSSAIDTEATDDETLKRHINLCSLIGNFFVRKLLAAKVMAQVMHDLIGLRDRHPARQFILCGSKLLMVIGRSLDANEKGTMLLTQFLARLSNLASAQMHDTREARYPHEVRNVIKYVHECRYKRWPVRPGTQVLFRLLELLETEDAATIKERLARLMRGGRDVEDDKVVTAYASLAPQADEKTDTEHAIDGDQVPKTIKVVVAASGRECALIEGLGVENLEEAPVKAAISRWTGIHPNRIMVVMPDGETILRDEKQ